MELDISAESLDRPFVSLWLHPAKTVRALVDRDPTFLVVPLAILAGIAGRFPDIAMVGPAEAMASAFRGAWVGLLVVWVGAAALRWSGNLLGGRATMEELRTALAWSGVPSIALVIFSLPGVALLGDGLHSAAFSADTSVAGLIAFGLWHIARIVFTIWRLFVFFAMVAEVHRFSRTRAVGSSLLVTGALFAIFVPLYLLGSLLAPAG